jgi:hypothetical protein
MANKIQTLPLERAYRYLKILEISNGSFEQLFETAKQLFEKGQISKEFMEGFEKTLYAKSIKNEEYISLLEERIFSSMKSDLGLGVNLPEQIPRLEESLKQEFLRIEKSRKENELKEEGPKDKPEPKTIILNDTSPRQKKRNDIDSSKSE